ncbi:glycosyltransferase family protein [Paenibacillus thermotolerans]|uniref:glycosyltransferase family protein n=1 Tax=Paenibacillus thermotolerans TaxID=3027807 RepID=UPI0023688F38|nr:MULTISPECIES: glycosyltransferase [unclassified Paenibacillus]
MVNVLHGPVDIAGQMGIYCKQLRKSGWTANGYNWYRNYFQYQSPIVQTDAYEIGKMILSVYQFADIVHFHNGSTFFKDFTDLSLLRKMGKKAVMHHWGNDVRNVEAVNGEQAFKLPPSYYTWEEISRRLTLISSYIDTAIIQDHELYRYIAPYYKNIYTLPLAIDASSIKHAVPSIHNNTPLIVHAPTNIEFKGTKYIESALEKLRNHMKFIYKRIEKMSHREAMDWYMRSDIVIDQVLCGTYGLLSVEAMAMGKPVVAYIRDDLRPWFPKDLPIVSASPLQLEGVLGELITNPSLRHELGRKGRQFVAGHHDVQVVMPQLLRIYKEL